MLKRAVRSSTDKELACFALPKERWVEYKLFTPPHPQKAEGILAILPGCGMDNDDGYLDHLASFCVESFGVAVALIDFHAIGSRLKTGSILFFDSDDKARLFKACKDESLIPQGLVVHPSVNIVELSKEELKKYHGNFELLRYASMVIGEQKDLLTGTLLTKKDGYQNFGVLSALDIINALLDAKAFLKNEGLLKDLAKVALCGTSHGAYLALLCAKFAPFLINFVLENSGYVSAPSYYCHGKASDPSKPAFLLMEHSLKINCFSNCLFSLDPSKPNFFSKDHASIRDAASSLTTYASFANTSYRSHHYTGDNIAPFTPKEEFVKCLKEAGVEASLAVYTDDTPLEPPFTKYHGHGLGMSLKQLLARDFEKFFKTSPSKSLTSEGEFELCFELERLKYTFMLKDNFYELFLS